MTTLNFIPSGSAFVQDRLDRAQNSSLKLEGTVLIKQGSSSALERESRMLQAAAAAGVKTPTVYSYEEEELRLEFIPNAETLLDAIHHGCLTKSLWNNVVTQVNAMHNAGIVHGDLHVNNILCNRETEEVYIIDMASSFNEAELCLAFGEDDFTNDLKEGIASDKEALVASVKAARQTK